MGALEALVPFLPGVFLWLLVGGCGRSCAGIGGGTGRLVIASAGVAPGESERSERELMGV